MPGGRNRPIEKSGWRATEGSSGTSSASGTSDPGAAISVTRWPASARPRARQTTIRCVPP